MDIIDKLTIWGEEINNINPADWESIKQRALNRNPWFTIENQDLSLEEVSRFLNKDKIIAWSKNYDFSGDPKNVGIVMAGNIPLVGFHDLICVLASQNIANIKLSSKDDVLLPYLTSILIERFPDMKVKIRYLERLNEVDAIIATGSDNSARYFEYYFRNKPHIIRKNRTSLAVLEGDESLEEIHGLGNDIVQYFGLGCRNISKLLVPEAYNFNFLFESLESVSGVINHHKYQNNYDYNKSIYLVNKEPFLDTGFMLFKETDQFVSPISVVFYQYYKDREELYSILNDSDEKIQCIVSHIDNIPNKVDFGKTQQPELWDYADNVDTMKFLEKV